MAILFCISAGEDRNELLQYAEWVWRDEPGQPTSPGLISLISQQGWDPVRDRLQIIYSNSILRFVYLRKCLFASFIEKYASFLDWCGECSGRVGVYSSQKFRAWKDNQHRAREK